MAGAEAAALKPCHQGGFLVQEQFPHLNWLSRALGVALAPLNIPVTGRAIPLVGGKKSAMFGGDVLAAPGKLWRERFAGEEVQGSSD